MPDVGSWITTGTFAAAQLLPQLTGRSLPFPLDANALFTILAWYTLLYAGTSLVQQKDGMPCAERGGGEGELEGGVVDAQRRDLQGVQSPSALHDRATAPACCPHNLKWQCMIEQQP